MNILHYSLGFPPYRRGGMTKYCIDLMAEQIKSGNKVSMMWPGRIKKYGYKCSIKEVKEENIGNNLICSSYEIINPLPVPLLDGIKEVDTFIEPKEESVFYSFFKENDVQIFHIHTLMGLPRECIKAAKSLGVKIVYTTHDYFGICPKWGLVHNGKICDDDNDCKKCLECNETALSLNKIKILQSSLYRNIKDMKIIKCLRKKHNDCLYKDSSKNLYKNSSNDLSEVIKNSQKYKNLRNYYIGMLENMDAIHFNSYNTEDVFKKYFNTEKNGRVISITHGSICDNRKIKKYTEDLNLGYLGPITEHKGFYSLKQVCDSLYNEYDNKFKLHIYSYYEGDEKYLVNHKPYNYEELETVMDSIDILIVPSLWNETFGFTVLEALSYGVPVIASKYVGAKDLIKDTKTGIIYEHKEELHDILKNIIVDHKSKLGKFNEYIFNDLSIKQMVAHSNEIEKLYLSLI